MLLTYLDESYNDERYYIAALAVPEDQVRPLTLALDKVVEDVSWEHPAVSLHAELHGKELFQGHGAWRSLQPRQRIAVYRSAFEAITAHNVDIIVRGVMCQKLIERYKYPEKPHRVVLGHLLERVDSLAARKADLALVIADEVQGQNEHRQDLWTFQRYATPGYKSKKITRVVDTMHFVPSHASRMVQACDLIAYLYLRLHGHKEKSERVQRANEELWTVVQPRLQHEHTWWP